MTDPTTYKGLPCDAVRGSVVVGVVASPLSWCDGEEGNRRACVRIRQQGKETVYIDDRDGTMYEQLQRVTGRPWRFCLIPVDNHLTFTRLSEEDIPCSN